MRASDIMTTDVVAALPETPVAELANLLRQQRISAIPVVDRDGRLQGIVSEGDLMRRPESDTEPHHSWWLWLVSSPEDHARDYLKTHGLSAKDVMTRNVISVAPDATAREIAELLERHRIKRVPVVSGGRVVGIVSRADLLHMLASQKPASAAAPAADADIRKRIIRHLGDEGIVGMAGVNPIVTDGVAHLWGYAGSTTQRDAIVLAAEKTEGVKAVVSHLGILPATARRVIGAE